MTRRLASLSCAAVLVVGLTTAASARGGAPTANDDPLVGVFENVYVKPEGIWKIRRSTYRPV